MGSVIVPSKTGVKVGHNRQRSSKYRGPANNFKRNEAHRESDRNEFAKMYLEGKSLREMQVWVKQNRDYELSIAGIGNDLRHVRQYWLDSQIIDFNEIKAKELAKIDNLEQEYWSSWYNSLKKKETIDSERVDDVATSKRGTTIPAYQRTKVHKKEETNYGEIKFLQGVQWCIEQRCKIFGLNAPTKVSVNWRREAERSGLDPGEIFNGLVGRFLDEHEDKDDNGTQNSDTRLATLDGSSRSRSLAGSQEEDQGE